MSPVSHQLYKMSIMEELIDILTQAGKKTGENCPKSEIHAKGHYHNTVHIWFYDDNGSILLTQRSAGKTIHPLLWDVSVAGHVDTGERLKEAAVREIKEELNLKVKKKYLNKIGVFECFHRYENGIIDNEFHHTYICNLQFVNGDITPAEDEVEGFKLVSTFEFSEILDHIGKENHFVPSNKAYYETVFNAILKQLS